MFHAVLEPWQLGKGLGRAGSALPLGLVCGHRDLGDLPILLWLRYFPCYNGEFLFHRIQ